MFARRYERRLVAWVRPGLSLLTLAGFLAGTVGVPVPVLLVKDLSQPFPCMHRKCGCQSAAQCWRGCCCSTNQEKLAWAARHGVQAPGFVAVAARREADRAAQQRSCCAAETKRESCCAEDSLADATCGDSEPTPPAAFEIVLAVSARKCRGQADVWLTQGAVSTPPAQVELTLAAPCCGDVALELLELDGLLSSPATPPPRA